MLKLLGDFIGELRATSIPVSMSEHVDAARALEVIDLADQSLLRASLAATLIKDGDHLAAFHAAFDVFFARRPALTPEGDDLEGAPLGPSGATRASAAPASAGTSMSAAELAALLLRALESGDGDDLARVAREAVARYAGVEAGRPVGGTYYLYRTLRHLDLEAVEAELVARALAPDGDELAERLVRDAVRARLEGLRQEVERVIRELLVADRGAKELARSIRRPLPEDIDVMHANQAEMAQLQRALRPLSRKLAVRLARQRRRRRRGPVDLRATLRRSLSTGGVPLDLRYKRPRPAKPEIFVIADVSGSVASFARFTLHLVHAIASQFSMVRSFVFVDGLDEVTALFEGVDDPAEAVARIQAEADFVAIDGHSDYGRALTLFHLQAARDLTTRSTVLILGDARNNYHDPSAHVLGDVAARAKALYWLNPEPAAYWNSGDSVMREYARYCDKVIECRTLRQLEAFVGGLAGA